jgi:hypothetical protein
MRVLMLGNSLTSAHDLPGHLSDVLGSEVVAHTRGGARLAEQLNPSTRSGSRTLSALSDDVWDFVVMQEMSNGPIVSFERYLEAVEGLASLARKGGAAPIIYQTWAYEEGSARLARSGWGYAEMHDLLARACREAGRRSQSLVAPVGDAFFASPDAHALYARDGAHPSEQGTDLAVRVIAETILG